MGANYVLGIGVQQDPAKGVALLKAGCDHGEPEACETYAYSLAYGFGGSRDDDAARVLFERECDQRGDSQCHGLAQIYVEGRGVPKDLGHALELYQRACGAGTAIACSMFGNMSPDLPDAVRRDVLTRACDLGDSSGCTNLGLIEFKAGHHREAADRFRLACAMSAGTLGCSRLAELYLAGKGVEHDPARARAMFERACDSGDQQGCHLYARRLLDGDSVPPDPERGLRLLEQMCDQLWPASCAAASEVIRDGTVVRADPARAATYQARACDLSPRYCPADGAGSGSGSATH